MISAGYKNVFIIFAAEFNHKTTSMDYSNKKMIFSIVMLWMSLSAFATGQEGDVIYMDGIQWELLGKPVYADSILSHQLKEALPKDRGFTSANWSGYTAYWSIWKEKLCLDSIQYQIYDDSSLFGRTERLSTEDLHRLFKKYVDGKRIVATWFDADIRLAKGKMIYYEHSGYQRNYENERIVSIQHGKVREVKDYHNYVIEGFAFDDYHPEATPPKQFPRNNPSELRKMFPLNIKQYPELAGQKRVVFTIKRAKVDATGHLVDCEVRVLKPADNPQLAAEMANAMKAYHPWRVFYINGEYCAYGINGWTIPYMLDEE